MSMEVNYGVSITNKFALFLNEDEDPLDILRLEEEQKTKKLDKKKTAPADKDSKIKNKTNKPSDAAVDQKKATATNGGQKKDDKAARTKGKPVQGETTVADKSQGKENNAAPRREGGNRPRPQSGTTRDAVPRDNVNRPERSGEQSERGGFSDRPNRAPRPQRFERSAGFGERSERPDFGGEKVEDGENTRGGFRRGGGRGRGGRGAGGFRGGRREFDRHSGSDRSGVKPQDKRDGAGAHNWGTISDDIQDQLVEKERTEETTTWGAQMEAADAQPTTERTKPDGEEDPANVVAEVAEEEKVLTLDEWKAQQGASRMKMEFNIRKAGEGCAADPQWKKMVALKKKETEEAEEEEEEEEEEESRHGRQKTTLSIPVKFNQAPKRGYGGRGRGRGGRGGAAAAATANDEGRENVATGEHAPRGRKPVQKAPNVADELDFPSLSANK